VETVAGAGIFLLTAGVFAMVGLDRELADNDLFKTLAQAVVVQGLVGLAMAAWFTKKASSVPEEVEIVQPDGKPLPVTETTEITPTLPHDDEDDAPWNGMK
jgi:hypothetical protein